MDSNMKASGLKMRADIYMAMETESETSIHLDAESSGKAPKK